MRKPVAGAHHKGVEGVLGVEPVSYTHLYPALGLIGCGLCGLSVGIMWPGTFSIATASIRGGGTALFALLALAGDLGCSGGPTFVGMVSGLFQDNLKRGILAAVVFPVLLTICVLVVGKRRKGAATARLHQAPRP